MAAEDQHDLHVSLSTSELELLRQVARSEQGGDISAWARTVLLEVAKTRKVEQPPEKKPTSSRPKCGCGWTASPKGECDLTCIMRY